mgnify:CR=1 FL=1
MSKVAEGDGAPEQRILILALAQANASDSACDDRAIPAAVGQRHRDAHLRRSMPAGDAVGREPGRAVRP